MSILLGCIADDFTGATDLANNLVRGGMRVVQANGVPGQPLDCSDWTILDPGISCTAAIAPGSESSAARVLDDTFTFANRDQSDMMSSSGEFSLFNGVLTRDSSSLR